MKRRRSIIREVNLAERAVVYAAMRWRDHEFRAWTEWAGQFRRACDALSDARATAKRGRRRTTK